MKPTDQQIEEAAQALRNHVAARTFKTDRRAKPWETLPGHVRQQYRDEVAVVVAALITSQDAKSAPIA